MNVRHTLQVTLQSDETVRVGRNHLQLIVRNDSKVMSFEQVVIRLFAPLGVTLQPSKVEFVDLQINSRDSRPVTLTTKRPGSHPIKIEANFPKSKEGFLHMTQQVEVYPELDIMPNPVKNSILEEIAHLQTSHNHSSKTSKRSNDEGDIYSKYLTGLDHLRRRIEQGHPLYSEFLAYEQQLKEIVFLSQRHGDTDSHRARRSQVIEYLNKLTLSVLQITFNELCELGS